MVDIIIVFILTLVNSSTYVLVYSVFTVSRVSKAQPHVIYNNKWHEHMNYYRKFLIIYTLDRCVISYSNSPITRRMKIIIQILKMIPVKGFEPPIRKATRLKLVVYSSSTTRAIYFSKRAGQMGLEPTTFSQTTSWSSQLIYYPLNVWHIYRLVTTTFMY